MLSTSQYPTLMKHNSHTQFKDPNLNISEKVCENYISKWVLKWWDLLTRGFSILSSKAL